MPAFSIHPPASASISSGDETPRCHHRQDPCAAAAMGHSSGNALGMCPPGALAGNFGRGAQCGIEHPFAPVDFLAHVQDQ